MLRRSLLAAALAPWAVLAVFFIPAGFVHAQAATAPAVSGAGAAPALAFFPLAKGDTWKYRVIVKTGDVADKPYVQTITAVGAVQVNGQAVYAMGDELYIVKDDAAYLWGRRDGEKMVAAAQPCKIVPGRPRTGDSWNWSSGGDSTYATCLGKQTIKTDGGEFETVCIFASTGTGGAAAAKQVYRYYARNVGLVRETIADKVRKADGTLASRQVSRDLLAFTPPDDNAPASPPHATPLDTDAIRGQLLDPSHQPMAQVPLTLRRLDKPSTESLQTDASGMFSRDHLDPAGVYALEAMLGGYEPVSLALHSPDHKALHVDVVLKAEVIPTGNLPASALRQLFDDGRRLAEGHDHKGAIAKYDQALAMDGNQANIHAYKALSLLALGQPQPADAEISEALRQNDKEYTFLQIAGQTKIALNQTAAGRDLYEKAARMSPANAGAIYTDLAAALASRNDDSLSGAIEAALKAAAASDPPGVEALFQLGQSYANAGRIEGKTYLQRYLDAMAKLPPAQRNARKMQLARQLIKALDVLKEVR